MVFVVVKHTESNLPRLHCCFLEKEFFSSRYIAEHGHVFHPPKVNYKIMCPSGCHDNVTILYHLGAIEHMCTGFTLDADTKRWIHHSWGVDKGSNLVETCAMAPDMYFGVVLRPSSTFQLPQVVGKYPLQYDFDSLDVEAVKKKHK